MRIAKINTWIFQWCLILYYIIISPHIKGVMKFSTTVFPESNRDLTTHSLILGCVSNISLLMTECVAPKTIRNVISFPSTVSVCVGILAYTSYWYLPYVPISSLSFFSKKKSFTSMISVCVVHSPSRCVMCSSQSRSPFKVAGSSLSSIPASVPSAS